MRNTCVIWFLYENNECAKSAKAIGFGVAWHDIAIVVVVDGIMNANKGFPKDIVMCRLY